MTGSATPGLQCTTWSRDGAAVGIVHLGYGAFHRAHQAVYVDDFMEASGDRRWGIAAVNLRASESDAFEAAQQATDGYLLKTMAPDGTRVLRLVRSHLAFADWAVDAVAAEALVARPSVHVVSMTVTESGYFLKSDRTLDTGDPVIAAELAGGPGRSVYAYLAGALEARRAAGGAPLTVLCCDNIRANGDMLERNVLAWLEAAGRAALADWVRRNVSFPCAMVDRITPRATPELVSEIGALFPGRQLAPIHAEAFIQWVVEDRFAGPFPDLRQVGVQVVHDVDPYEEAKIRILNGGHTGLCYLGALAGHQTFDEAMRDPAIRAHFDRWEADNVLPGLSAVPVPFDKTDYLAEIAARFGNAAIADRLERICMDGWSKFPIYIRPTLAACLAQGIAPRPGYDCIASWYVYARRVAAGTMPIAYAEPYWSILEPLLAPGRETAFAGERALWGDLPTRYADFVPGVVDAIGGMSARWSVAP